ncbi:MAG TPA: NAD-dependent epimerase/dehydratase family protein [Mycobacterium sp.]|nr:NAD-dependent epimerase/dehydratase family protein [Mycobacterium sp.]
MTDVQVLVTGGSGFVGAHCIVALLNAGCRVRTTIRWPERESDVRRILAAGGAPARDITFAITDLTRDDGWVEAVDGCDYVLHVASPYPPDEPRHEDDVIVPARDGTLTLYARRIQRGRQADRLDVLIRCDRIRPRHRSCIHRTGLDRPRPRSDSQPPHP